MIVFTKSIDGICRRAFDSSLLYSSKVVDICQDILVDPEISSTIKDCFIVSDNDMKAHKVKAAFVNACEKKHPKCKIVVVCKNVNSNFIGLSGIDACLINPTPQELQDCVKGIISSASSKPEIISAADSVIKHIDDYNIPQPNNLNPADALPVPDIEQIDLSIPESLTSDIPPVSNEEPEDMPNPTDIYADRIKRCDKLGDLNNAIREIDATRVVKDLMQQTASYAGIEDRLSAIREKILSIYADPNNGGFSEAHKKVRAFIADRNVATEESVTQLERCVSNLILDVTNKAVEVVESEISKIDDAIARVSCTHAPGVEFSKLAGIMNAHSDIKLEIAALMTELRSIYCGVDNLASSTASEIAMKTVKVTGSEIIDAHMKLRNEVVSTPAISEAITSVIETSNSSQEKFVEADLKLKSLMTKLDNALQLSDEVIEAQATIINYITSHKIEDTVIAQTLIKKSMRVFIGNVGSGIHTIPYIMSSIRSRQNANTLLCDFTGKSDFTKFDHSVHSLDDFLNNVITEQFCVVSGRIESVEMTQRVMTALYKYADYYRVINIILDVTQVDVFNAISPDTLSINYVIDTSRDDMTFYKDFLTSTMVENVAQRVILNMCPQNVVASCIDNLGIYDNFNVMVSTIPYIKDIVVAKYCKVDPALQDGVTIHFKEVIKCLS